MEDIIVPFDCNDVGYYFNNFKGKPVCLIYVHIFETDYYQLNLLVMVCGLQETRA
ncbi:hypothetical protein MNBD_ALPHA11-1101 [hydrothermal vent metagenome]|uniref:Uncharacterized protein n=1 Tax=hydrothermal vent metagenome TaxID=652676 RepID=A0A3B0USW6_9ZZZZ